MPLWVVILLPAAIFALSVLSAKYMYAMRHGTFRLVALGGSSVHMMTDGGKLKIDAKNRTLNIRSGKGGKQDVPFENILGIKFRANSDAQRISERLNELELRDLILGFRDTTDYFAINLVKADLEEIPVFWVAQSEPRQMVMFTVHFARWLTSFLRGGRHDDLAAYSRTVYETVLQAFKAAGLDLRVM